MPRTDLLDAGVVIVLQRTGHLDALASIAAQFKLLVVEEVYDEVTNPPGGKYANEAAQAKAALDVHTESVSLDPTSDAARRLDALRSRKKKITKADLGEAASVAWLLDHADTTFVTRDAAASFLALDELQSRVTTFFQFLRDAVDAGTLDAEKARLVATAAPITDGVRAVPPLWWDAWIAGK